MQFYKFSCHRFRKLIAFSVTTVNPSNVEMLNVNAPRASTKGSQMSVDENRQVSESLRESCHGGLSNAFL